jgi:type IV pilus assembly protein PilW
MRLSSPMPFSSRGLTLIELMIAMTLGLIVVAGMIQIFVTTKNSFRLQESLNFAQENARFAMHFLEYDARMADHWGGVESGQINNLANFASSGNTCAPTWLFDLDKPIEGFDGVSTSSKKGNAKTVAALGNCVKSDNYEPGTDILIIRYAAAESAPESNLPDKMPYLEVLQGLAGSLKIAGAPQKKNTATTLPSTLKPSFYPFIAHAYFVRRCSSADNDICPNDVSGQQLRTLTRLVYDGTRIVEEPLIEGITDLQISYAVDTDKDGYADGCAALTASQVSSGITPADKSICKFSGENTPSQRSIGWTDVVGLNITLTVQPQRCLSWTDKGCSTTKGQKVFSKAIQLRNRSRG